MHKSYRKGVYLREGIHFFFVVALSLSRTVEEVRIETYGIVNGSNNK